MSYPVRRGIAVRLRSLPGQCLLALINGTTVLLIAGAVLILIASASIQNFVETTVSTLTESVLSKVDLPSKEVLTNIGELTREVRALNNSLREIRPGENPVVQSRIVQLKEALTLLSSNMDQLRSSRSVLTNEVATRAGDAISHILLTSQGCSSKDGPH
jgi:hypothetical protein